MGEPENLLENIRQLATVKINRYPSKVVYHNIKFANRYQGHIDAISHCKSVSEENRQLGKLAGWIIAASFGNLKVEVGKNKKPKYNLEEEVSKTIGEFSIKQNIPEEISTTIKLAIREMDSSAPTNTLSKLLTDAKNLDLVVGKNKKNLEKLYEELLLHGANLSKGNWNKYALNVLQNIDFHTPICSADAKPKLQTLISELEKEKKQIKKQSDLALRKQFSIDETELKQLKKNLENSSGRDDRGIQTMFRITSRNHYTLNEMVDKKANIMITINAIILSILVGGFISQVTDHGHIHFDSYDVPVLIMTLTATLSIMFAILAIRPDVTHGHFSEEDIRNKKGNLLFFGNFHSMDEKDFEWGFLEMMNDQDFLYSSMIKDLYYLGKVLERKYRQIRKSLTIFLYGIITSIVTLFIMKLVFDL
jgi:hypothetical protein